MHATVVQTRPGPSKVPVEETCPGEAKDSVVSTRPGEAQAPQCVDTSECSTGLCSVCVCRQIQEQQMQATDIQTRSGAAQGPEEVTLPGAAQDSVVQTSSGEARAQCVDRSKCSTGICSIDKPRAAQATVVQTCTCTIQVSPVAATAPVFL
jgi:hypothetical protein